ncbi:glutamate--cysteine ligase catalytic subunit [Chelonus insularis]|uniref:glutamate--cysteine ligase catalytic subunit n=1 Tax=Chelonus insularis TaxID=460826 RepID=UPI00158AD89A|nr:glutamate--cysteine ligase catalytic subunit [Chelonus insularis]XP_034939694.1 glutamate--cysteine ligase catalytic subunit [Chelonus insularis]
MGLLTEGEPLSWEETKKLSEHVKKHGIIQFINLYKKLRDRQGDVLKWGDEVEYMIIKFDDNNKTAKLSLRSDEILAKLNEKEEADPSGVKCLWRPEFGAYMIESTPGQPYGGLSAHFNIVEANMKYRRQEAMEQLQPNERIITFTNFLRLGCPNSTDPTSKPTPNSGYQRSLFLSDDAVFPGHPRFKTLATNIRQRRGEKVIINVPIYKDENVPSPFREDLRALGDDGSSEKVAKDDHVYMDAMGFGMGCCCLQVTFQASNIQEARTLYDQLTPFCPIMLALTAACPVYRGHLTDIDGRWFVISNSVDCRTRGERGLEPLKENERKIRTSRYGAVESYLSEQGAKYNDVPLLYDEEVFKQLLDNGIDRLLAQHVAHLFIRDCVCLMSTQLDQDDEVDTNHFENIQSTNWQSMRFKPPPPNSSIGWRVEFRPCDVQLTDFENAALVCFIVLLSRVILSYNLNLLIPISKVEENMTRGVKRDAVNTEKFWFRKDITSTADKSQSIEEEYGEFTVNEIINGKDGVFVGLMPLIVSYLNNMNIDADTHCTVQRYLKLIQKRAAGKLMTTASWLRKQITTHPDYKKDAKITEQINYDILKKVYDIQTGVQSCPELLGFCTTSKTTESVPTAIVNAIK